MKRIRKRNYRAPAPLLLSLGVLVMSVSDCQAQPPSTRKTRRPAVAGQFYESSPDALRRDVEQYLNAAGTPQTVSRMIISPHAGFVFSGPLAGRAWAQVDRTVERVILLGPSHRAYFEGVSIAGVDAYATPLGEVLLDTDIVAALRKSPLVSSVAAAHAAEHCLEVQLPFLQVVVPKARIVPILMGRVEAARVVELLKPFVDKRTLVVASSDFSHYHASAEAKKIDARSVQTILAGDLNGPIDGCGEAPVRVLMALARDMGLKAVLLDARNSHETAPKYGGADRVVGYAAIVFVPGETDTTGVRTASETRSGEDLDAALKEYLLRLARRSLEAAVRGEKPPSTADAPSGAKSNSGCFVTLHKDGQLRGCIGYIEPIKPLAEAVADNAKSAALNDPRFPKVAVSELSRIEVEVSVLTAPQPLDFSGPEDLLRKLVPGRDGVILESGFNRSTFLPQVWEQLPGTVEFLQHLSRKAGMAADGWKTAKVKTYQAVHFSE